MNTQAEPTLAAIQAHARDLEHAALMRQAAQPLPEPALNGIQAFNRREFYVQHELLEEAWRDELGPVRQLYQGILQVGVAYYHIQRRNYVGARRMFQRAWQYLSAMPGVCQGVDVAQLRRDVQAAQAELERLGPDRIEQYDPVFFRSITVDCRKSTVDSRKSTDD